MAHYKTSHSNHFIVSAFQNHWEIMLPRGNLLMVGKQICERKLRGFFTEELCFIRNGLTNFHNLRILIGENPQDTPINFSLCQFSINVCMYGICWIFFDWSLPLLALLNGDSHLNVIQNTAP